ncbi:uncharacterized protein LOC141910157 [Tubulanus polymorphus]|uniref:uncharacterized protein LOC141910157 n=1 Tax=Tubulanus polymorphus TaxID=672921 RepID=UPI003DA3FD0F
MLSLKHVVLNNSKFYTKPVKVLIAAKQLNQRTNKYEYAICDEERTCKAISYEDCIDRKLKEGDSVLLRNFEMGKKHMLLSKKCVITKTKKVNVPQKVVEEARALIIEIAPVARDIAEIKFNDTDSNLSSITGRIVKDEEPRDVKITATGANIKVRNIVVEDKTANIDVVLWADKSSSPIKLGDSTTITHLLTATTKDNIKQLRSTYKTEITLKTPEVTIANVTFLGIESATPLLYCVSSISTDDEVTTYSV